MKTQKQAINEGYDVDLSGPGRPMGAKGKYPDFDVIPLDPGEECPEQAD